MKLGEVLDRSLMRRFHYSILSASFVGWMFDAMNSGLISFVIGPMSRELSLSLYQAGLMLSSWTLGMLVGGIVLGGAADRLGRKPVILASILLYSVFAGLTGFSDSWQLILVFRFVAGMGASSFMAVTSTLISEYFPDRARGRAVAFLESAWGFGWLLASYLGLVLVSSAGWRTVMLTGFAALAAAPIILLVVPESARWLEKRGKPQKADEIMGKVGLKPAEGIVYEPEVESRSVGVRDLWSEGRSRRTLMLWIHWFCLAFSYWGIFLWAPTILMLERGLAVAKALEYTFIITAVQIPGYWSGAYLIERLGRRLSLAVYMAGAGVGSVMFAYATSPADVLLWGSVISFFCLGAWGITYAYTPELYPTRIRASGAGWANSVGRVGSFLGPILVGWLLSATGTSSAIFLVFTVLFIASAVNVLLLGIETKGTSLE